MNPLARLRDRVRGSRSLPREVYVLGLVAFCVMVGFGVIIPVLPVFARTFGASNFQIGAVISAFALMRLVASPFCGWMIRGLGERVVMAVGIYIVAVSSGLAGMAQNYEQLLVLRGVGGIGSAMFTVSAYTLLLTCVEPGMRGRAAGFFQGGFLIGGMTGPAVGGLLLTISLTAPFFFYAGTLVIAGTVGLVLLHHRSTPAEASADARAVDFKEIVWDPRYQAACFTNFAQGWMSFGVRSSLVPVLIVESLHREPAWVGISFAVTSVVQTIAVGPAGRYVDLVGRRPAMIIGTVLGALAALAIPFAPNIWLLTVALSAYGVASAFLGTAPAAAVGDAGAGRRGMAVAAFSMCADIGAIIGPLVAGWLADLWSYPAAFGVGAAIMLVGAALAYRMPRTEVSTAAKSRTSDDEEGADGHPGR